jgi:hypothetical protein
MKRTNRRSLKAIKAKRKALRMKFTEGATQVNYMQEWGVPELRDTSNATEPQEYAYYVPPSELWEPVREFVNKVENGEVGQYRIRYTFAFDEQGAMHDCKTARELLEKLENGEIVFFDLEYDFVSDRQDTELRDDNPARDGCQKTTRKKIGLDLAL